MCSTPAARSASPRAWFRDTQREPLIANTADDYDKLRKSRERSGQSELATLEKRAPTAFPTILPVRRPPPQYPGLHHFGDWPLKDLKASIDWTPFFRAWELAGTYPAILDDPVVGESARACSPMRKRCSTR